MPRCRVEAPKLASIEPGRLSAPRETRSAAFSRDGRRLASSGYDSMVHIWDVDRRELLLILEDDDRHYEGVGFTDDGRLVVDRISGWLTIWNSRPPR